MNKMSKTLLFSILLTSGTTTLAMERPVARPQEQALVEQLSQAVQSKNFERYFALLSKEPLEKQKLLVQMNLLARQGKIKKAIHFAAEQGNDEALKALLKLGANIEERGELHGTPLFYAVRQKKLSTLLLLLEKGANKLAVGCGMTALHSAAEYNNVTAILTLIRDHGLDVNAAPVWTFLEAAFRTPLHVAAAQGQLDAINALIDNGARESALDSKGRTALHDARSKAAVLLLITKHDFNPNALDTGGRTPLHYAVQFGSYETVKTLIENGSRTDLQDAEGLSLLHYAAQVNNGPMIAFLIKDYGLNPNITAGPTHNHATPLGMIIELPSCCSAAFALSCGGAELPGHTEQERELNKRKFNNFCFSHLKTDADKQTMLDALSKGSWAPWDPNDVDSTDHSTALIKAAEKNHQLCVKLLLKDSRTNPNIQDSRRRTALHYAVEIWQKIIVKGRIRPRLCSTLLNLQRTNVGVKDKNGKTARDLIIAPNQLLPVMNLFKNLPRALELSKLFDLRKMRVQTYLALKNARCSEQCPGKTCTHIPLPADVCLKIARLLTEDSLPERGMKNHQETTEESAPAPTIAGSAIIGQLYSMCQGFLGQRQ